VSTVTPKERKGKEGTPILSLGSSGNDKCRIYDKKTLTTDHIPIMIGQKGIVLRLGHNMMKKRELLVQIIMKSVVATSAADMNCLRVIPDKVTSLTVALYQLYASKYQ